VAIIKTTEANKINIFVRIVVLTSLSPIISGRERSVDEVLASLFSTMGILLSTVFSIIN
jgi:hypothetical protein